MQPSVRSPTADRVFRSTRILSACIIPFLAVAFVVLYFRPSADDTARLFAWRISPPFTPMMLAAAYAGGAYFFARAMTCREWHRIAGGFLPVTAFATMLDRKSTRLNSSHRP